MDIMTRINTLGGAKAALIGAAALLAMGCCIGFFIDWTNWQRGFGVTLLAVGGLAAIALWLEGHRRLALFIVFSWLLGVIAAPGLIRSADILARPVSRNVSPHELARGFTGIAYLENTKVATDLKFSFSDQHTWHTYSQKRKSVIYSNDYRIAPLVGRDWQKDRPVTAWASFVVQDKLAPSRMRYMVDWSEPFNAAVVHAVDRDVLDEMVAPAGDRHGIKSVKEPLIVFLAYNPVEEARMRFAVYGGLGVLVLAAWAIFCVFGKSPGPEKKEG